MTGTSPAPPRPEIAVAAFDLVEYAVVLPANHDAVVGRLRDFPTDRGRCLLSSARPRPLGPITVLKPGDAHGDTVATAVRLQHALGVELFPAILVVGLRGVGIRLGQLRFSDRHIAIHAHRGGQKVSGDARVDGRLRHVEVDE